MWRIISSRSSSRICRFGQQSIIPCCHFSTSDAPPPRPNLSSPPAPLRQPLGAPPPAAPSGTDYISLFQPTFGNAITAYTPGSVLKIYPLPRFLLKEDMLHHLRGSDIKPENVKFVYNSVFRPDYLQLDVDSAMAQRQIMRRLQVRGRLGCRFLRAEVVAPTPWTFAEAALKDAPRGKTLVMWNVQTNTTTEDVERFFQGYNYDAGCIHIINLSNDQAQPRGPNRRPNQTHVAVGFSSKFEALRAMREKTGEFCLNVPVNLRLIQ